MDSEHGLTCECGQTFQNPENLTKHVQLQRLELTDYEPRTPNPEELEQIVEWYTNTFKQDYERAVETVNQSYFVVIDGYTTGCPGFAGKVLIEIGSAGPRYYTVYTWNNDDQLQRRKQARELQKQKGVRSR